MDRRELLGALGAGAIGLTALSAHADEKSDDHCCDLDKTHEDCLKACSECAKACQFTFHHCYKKVAEGKAEHAKPLHLVADCGGFCTLSAGLIARQSPLMAHSCLACAEACKATATEVEKFESEEMKHTAKHLRECERSCRAMVAAMASSSGLKAN
jgi:hypothetical protein